MTNSEADKIDRLLATAPVERVSPHSDTYFFRTDAGAAGVCRKPADTAYAVAPAVAHLLLRDLHRNLISVVPAAELQAVATHHSDGRHGVSVFLNDDCHEHPMPDAAVAAQVRDAFIAHARKRGVDITVLPNGDAVVASLHLHSAHVQYVEPSSGEYSEHAATLHASFTGIDTSSPVGYEFQYDSVAAAHADLQALCALYHIH